MEALNQIEKKWLHNILLNMIKNGNTANSEQYKTVYSIIEKLQLKSGI